MYQKYGVIQYKHNFNIWFYFISLAKDLINCPE